MILISTAVMADTHIVLYDIDQGNPYDVTEFFLQVTGFESIENITSLNTGNGEGDELLMISGDEEVAILETVSFKLLGILDHQDLRNLFGLGSGTGNLSALTVPGRHADELLYFDEVYSEYFVLDFNDYTFHPYNGTSLPDGYVTGFSFTSSWDNGILNKKQDTRWFYESLHRSEPALVEFDLIFGEEPDYITEFELAAGQGVFRFLAAVLPGESPEPTPTPTQPPTSFDAIIAMGLGETLSRVDGSDYNVDENISFTGQSPNQIVVREAQFYVVNSLSHSIGVYDTGSYQKIREISVGAGRNPYFMAFRDNDHAYVTNFQTNTVSLINISSGSPVTEIHLPDSQELPHDDGITTWARPGELTIVGETCYVACANLDDVFAAGGPGVVCKINTSTQNLDGWFPSNGRNTVSVVHHSRWNDYLWVINAGDYAFGTGFLGNGSLGIYSLSGGSFVDSIDVGDAPYEITFGSDRAYLASAMDGLIQRLDLNGFSLMQPVSLPNAGQGLNFVSGISMGPDNLL